MDNIDVIKASSKPVSSEFNYVYSEDANKAFVKIPKETLRQLLKRVDSTLTVADEAAEAKATGDAIKAIRKEVDEIERPTDEQIALIEAKGAEILASIPSDYTELYNVAMDNKKSKAGAIICSASGKEIVVTDSDDNVLHGFTLHGKGEQAEYIGNQLLNLSDKSETISSGITWSCKNNVVTAKGTATGIVTSSEVGIYHDIVGMVGTFYIKGSSTNINLLVAVVKDGASEWYNNQSFTLDGTETSVLVYYQIETGTTVDETLYPMLNEGTEPLPFEPFTGGQPSPSQEYPQEIVNVGHKSRNLLKNTAKTTTINGVEFVVDDYGRVIANGTATDTTFFILNESVNLKAGTYGISDNANGGKNYYVRILELSSSIADNLQFTLSEDKENLRVEIRIASGVTVSNVVFYPMLYQEGDGTWEPFTDKYILPIKARGKNKFDASNLTNKALDGNGNTFSSTDYLCNETYIEFTNPMTLSGVGSGEIRYCLYDSEKRFLKRSSVTPNMATIENTDAKYIRVCHETTIYNVQLEEGTKITPYEPHHEPHTEILELDEPLRAVKVTDASLATFTDENGQMWCTDEVDYENGKLIRRVNRINSKDIVWIAYGSQANHDNTGYVKIYSMYPVKLPWKITGDGISKCSMNNFGMAYNVVAVNITYSAICLYVDNSIYISLPKSVVGETADDFINYIANNPLIIDYVLAEPITEPLSETELAKLKRLQTFNPTTIFTNSDDGEMEIEYVADTKIYIDNKFKELEQALANTNAQLL